MKTSIRIFIALMLVLFANAQVPQQLSYQGRVTVEGQNFDGTGQFKFALVNAAGTTTLWSHDGTGNGGGVPSGSISLAVTKGLYAVQLGATNPIPPALFQNNADVRLRVWFDDGAHGTQQLAPDQKLAASAWALVAETANSVKPGSVTLAQLSPQLQAQLAGLLSWQDANKPVILGPTMVTGGEEVFFSANIVVTGAMTAGISGAPAGITYDFATQTLSGVVPTGGPFNFTLTATNPAGSTVANITLNPAPAVYVDTVTGNDAFAGTQAAPLKTIAKAIEFAAAAMPKRSVRVSKGVYASTAPLMLASGVSVFGQYDKATGWTRAPGNVTQIVNTTPVNGHVHAVQAVDLAELTKLDGFHITAGNATLTGTSSYGVAGRDCANLVISNNVITAGNGQAGANSGNGTLGGNGANGGNGVGGLQFQGNPPNPGEGGGPNGGYGGSGFDPILDAAEPGGSGVAPFGGAGGAAGTHGMQGGNGGNGASGVASTANGMGGAGGAGGSIVGATLHYLGGAGAQGTQGGMGGIGGGGGGGGGVTGSTRGGGGGGGGAGGFGCGGGVGGLGGGGSFAVFITGGSVSVLNCSLVAGAGGSGGKGGNGANGGAGGTGGAGGGGAFSTGGGGNGGDGGTGARGAGGGGGAGGPALGIAATATTTVTQSGNSFTLTTTGGGGSGGTGPVGNNGSAGAAGIIQNTKLNY